MAADLSIKPVPVSIDVLMPVHVQADRLLLERAIASVFAQELPPGTLWVLINGGDLADRQQLAHELPALFPFPSQTVMRLELLNQAGITPALNWGIERSNADWLARLDADDRMHPQRLYQMVAFLEHCWQVGSTQPDVVGSSVAILDPRGEHPTGQLLRRPCQDRLIRRYLCFGNPFIHPSVMLRRSLLLQVGGYRSVRQAEDLDLWLRLARIKGVHFSNLPEPLTFYTLAPGTLSHGRDSFLWSALCRLRHVTSPWWLVIYSPKIIADLLRYLLSCVSHG